MSGPPPPPRKRASNTSSMPPALLPMWSPAGDLFRAVGGIGLEAVQIVQEAQPVLHIIKRYIALLVVTCPVFWMYQSFFSQADYFIENFTIYLMTNMVILALGGVMKLMSGGTGHTTTLRVERGQ
ncbi:hypothetical protein P3342_005063 [Pyrenophora teres f. teres]|nr:hypothetical protein P3342_005063 [Pyrenophora teres f. teres]